MTEQTALLALIVLGFGIAGALVAAALLNHTRRTVTEATAHGAAVLAALAVTVAHTAVDTAQHLTNLRGPR